MPIGIMINQMDSLTLMLVISNVFLQLPMQFGSGHNIPAILRLSFLY